MRKYRQYIASIWRDSTFLLFILLMIATTNCREQTSSREPGVVTCETCVIQATTNNDNYTQGEPIIITATISVLDDTDVGFSRYNPHLNFELYITDAQGEIVQMTEDGITTMGARTSFLEQGIYPDQPFQEVFRIDTWFELSEPGTYTLTVQKRLEIHDKETNEFGYVEIVGEPVVFTRLP